VYVLKKCSTQQKKKWANKKLNIASTTSISKNNAYTTKESKRYSSRKQSRISVFEYVGGGGGEGTKHDNIIKGQY